MILKIALKTLRAADLAAAEKYCQRQAFTKNMNFAVGKELFL